jgi:propanol-preferring alcohol dehydrogenase
LAQPGWDGKRQAFGQLDRAVTFAPSGDVVIAASTLRKGGVVRQYVHLDRMPQLT